MLLSKSKRGNRSYLHCSDLAKASSKLFHKQIGLFERGEVAAAIQPVPINQIRIALLGPAARRAEKLSRDFLGNRSTPRIFRESRRLARPVNRPTRSREFADGCSAVSSNLSPNLGSASLLPGPPFLRP